MLLLIEGIHVNLILTPIEFSEIGEFRETKSGMCQTVFICTEEERYIKCTFVPGCVGDYVVKFKCLGWIICRLFVLPKVSRVSA
jgi:hypothetical protein